MKYLNLVLILAVVCIIVFVVGGGIARQAAQGYAEGGGSVEARLLSPETRNEAHAGDNGIAIATQGDDNSVNVAYSQATEQTPPADDGRFLALVIPFGIAAGAVLFSFWLLTANHQKAYQ